MKNNWENVPSLIRQQINLQKTGRNEDYRINVRANTILKTA